MYKKISPLLLLLLILISCTHSRVDPLTEVLNQQSTQSQDLRSLISLATLQQAKTVEIVNDWNGYSDITPILRHYKFRLERQELVGNAYVAVGGYGAAGIRQQQTTKVKIPAAAAAKFLEILATTPVETGIYKPKIARTDDYPHLKIQFNSDRQQTIFTSTSQGVGHAPWQVTVVTGTKTQAYISNSTIPDRALQVLDPYLNFPGIDGIIQRRRHRKK
jgi:hypothetical protein